MYFHKNTVEPQQLEFRRVESGVNSIIKLRVM